MNARCTGVLILALLAALVTGCGAGEPAPVPGSTAVATATHPLVPPAATAIPPSPTSTQLPLPTATSVPPTAVPPAVPTPAPLLSFENSPQSFGRSETFQAGLGDLDGDGDLDAVFANMAANDSQVWLNDGLGTFHDSGQKLTQQGHGLGLGDLDGDGDLDILMTCAHFGRGGGWSKRPSKVYLNDGQGVFHDSGQDLGDAEL
ncbi:MAG TPA: FG-GAP-like repeat-containing protein, partial [Anaerolineae bacterium]|nr:FG-GAP-like repeat-containing protein [Anaerolineae bacterium]